MRLLLIEDDAETVDLFVEVLGPIGVVVTPARTKSEADRAISEQAFDLAVCDLKIPSMEGLLDSSVQHGVAVLARLRTEIPGLPVIAFSAHGASPDLVKQMLLLSNSDDFLGRHEPEQLLRFLDKSELKECIDEIRRISSEIDRLSSIELSSVGLNDLKLSMEERRALQLCGRRKGAQVIRVEGLGGGLSGTRVLKLQLDGQQGQLVGRVVAKLGRPGTLEDERSRYLTLVSGVLELGTAPGVSDVVFSGAGRTGALVYELAHSYPKTLFGLLAEGDQPELVVEVRRRTSPWLTGAPTTSATIADVRRPLIADAAVRELISGRADLDLGEFERVDAMHVQVRMATQHGDLHGLNVLISDPQTMVLIDWGAARTAPASLDPVTLELSALFHPDSPHRNTGWPSIEQAEEWYQLDSYLRDCPIPGFITECRNWAMNTAVAAGNRELAAVVGSYAARQLKYPDTNHDLAAALMRGAWRFLQMN